MAMTWTAAPTRENPESVASPFAGRDLVRVRAVTLDAVVGYAEALMRPGEVPPGPRSSPISCYDGSAGTGLELLQHRADDPRVAPLVGRLARWTLDFADTRELTGGLFHGGTGACVFAAAAGDLLGEPELTDRARTLWTALVDEREGRDDLSRGSAGILLGSLAMGRHTGDASFLTHAAAQIPGLRLEQGVEALRAGPPAGARQSGNGHAIGFAYGLAGRAHALTAYLAARRALGDPAASFGVDLSLLDAAYSVLADRTAEFVRHVRTAGVGPVAASWCQGLAGIGTALTRAVRETDREDLIPLVAEVARAVLEIAPRMTAVSQCCGLAGVGEFLLDAGRHLQEPEYEQRARDIALLVLARTGGTLAGPVSPGAARTRPNGGWGTGSAGVLGFLRRLGSGGGRRVVGDLSHE
ncbi:lanthionine synthetase LanC family protein [Streptomyces sp. NPDC000410]|uniref:lanthionine synthetase LanC family protein n=1 Tax=Streptomyces sp. NPDC000410 TaxID=3154254 RepID=UPI0033260A57